MAAQDGDPASTLNFYRAALRARRADPALGDGPMSWLDTPEGVLAFRRGAGFACVVNYTDDVVDLPAELAGWKPVVRSAEADPGTIAGASAVWLAP